MNELEKAYVDALKKAADETSWGKDFRFMKDMPLAGKPTTSPGRIELQIMDGTDNSQPSSKTSESGIQSEASG